MLGINPRHRNGFCALDSIQQIIHYWPVLGFSYFQNQVGRIFNLNGFLSNFIILESSCGLVLIFVIWIIFFLEQIDIVVLEHRQSISIFSIVSQKRKGCSGQIITVHLVIWHHDMGFIPSAGLRENNVGIIGKNHLSILGFLGCNHPTVAANESRNR